jgi:transcriptional regulator with XRE-family HTH domain
MRDNLKALGTRLRAARIEAELGQPEIARRLNVSKQLVSHWELGRSEITIFDLAQFAQIVDADIQYLLTGLSAQPAGGVRLRLPGGRLVPKLTIDEIIAYGRNRLALSEVDARHVTVSQVGDLAFAFQPFDRAIYPDPATVTIVVDIEHQPQPGDVTLWLLGGTDVVLGRYRPSAGSKPLQPPFSLRFDDADFETRAVTRADKPRFLGTQVERAVGGSR